MKPFVQFRFSPIVPLELQVVPLSAVTPNETHCLRYSCSPIHPICAMLDSHTMHPPHDLAYAM